MTVRTGIRKRRRRMVVTRTMRTMRTMLIIKTTVIRR